MALKTFNIDAELYKKYSEYCRENGISMSKKINKFIESEVNRLGDEIRSDSLGVKRDDHPMEKYC